MVIWAVGRSALKFFFLFVMILDFWVLGVFFRGIALSFLFRGYARVIFYIYTAYQTRLFDVGREHSRRHFSSLYISVAGNASIAMNTAQISSLLCFRVCFHGDVQSKFAPIPPPPRAIELYCGGTTPDHFLSVALPESSSSAVGRALRLSAGPPGFLAFVRAAEMEL